MVTLLVAMATHCRGRRRRLWRPPQIAVIRLVAHFTRPPPLQRDRYLKPPCSENIDPLDPNRVDSLFLLVRPTSHYRQLPCFILEQFFLFLSRSEAHEMPASYCCSLQSIIARRY